MSEQILGLSHEFVRKSQVAFDDDSWQTLTEYVANEAAYYDSLVRFIPLAEEAMERGEASTLGAPRNIGEVIEDAKADRDCYTLEGGVLISSDYDTWVKCLIDGNDDHEALGILGLDITGDRALLVGSTGHSDQATDEFVQEQALATLVNLSAQSQEATVAYVSGRDADYDDAVALLLRSAQ